MSNSETKIITDFRGDWVAIMESRLRAAGYRVKTGASPEEVSRAFFNVQKRAIEIRPRDVVKSKDFSCPADRAAALQRLVDAVERAENLNPYLSRQLLNASYDDPLLNDWGFHHFHLGQQRERDGFVERSGPLLFARVSDARIYLIDVMMHGDWSKRRLAEICVRNWPELVQRYRLRGLDGDGGSVTEEEAKFIRKRHGNTVLYVDGLAYGPMGGGVACSGMSVEVVVQADRRAFELDAMSAHVRNHPDDFLQPLRDRGVTLPATIRLRFDIRDGCPLAVHDESGVAFRMSGWSTT